MAPLRRIIGFGLVLTALVAPHARAQHITGIVRDSASGASLAGAVVSVLDAPRQLRARAITDATGRYYLEPGAGAVQLRVVRIGFQPRELPLPASRGASPTVNILMARVPTLLSTVLVSDDRLCSSDRDRRAALSLWEQARSGLLASIVARESKPATATIISYERWIELSHLRVQWQTARKQHGLTSRPFMTRPSPAALAQHGYLEKIAGDLTFNAPDADVLLDDTFAETHCFSVRNEDSAHADAIGIAFEPSRGRAGIVDVRGTLWLEASVPALRSIEFSFVGGNAATVLGDAAGVIHFRTVANGVVFVDEWHTRAPVMVQTRDDGRPMRLARSVSGSGDGMDARPGTQANETGGIVSSAVWPDGTRWESPLEPLTGTVVVRGTTRPIPGALVAINATGDTVLTDAAGRWEIHPLFPGRYDVIAVDTSYSAFVAPRVTNVEVDITPAEQAIVPIGLPGRAESVRALCTGERTAGITSILLGRIVDSAGTARLPDGVRVSGAWLGDVTRMNGRLSWRHDGEAIEPDDKGRFSLCGVPRETALRLALLRLDVRVADTLIRIESNADVAELIWRVNANVLRSLVAQRPARLEGRVTSKGSATPLSGVEIWLPSLDRRAMSDATGTFVFDSLPPGYQMLAVRHAGFATRHDTLRLVAGRATTRDYELVPLAPPTSLPPSSSAKASRSDPLRARRTIVPSRPASITPRWASASRQVAVEHAVEIDERRRAREAGERSLFSDLLRRFQKSAPRCASQRTSHTDATHAGVRQLRNRGEVSANQRVHRLRCNCLDDHRDAGDVANAGRIETVGARIGVGEKAADRLGEIGATGDEPFRPSGEQHTRPAIVDCSPSRPDPLDG